MACRRHVAGTCLNSSTVFVQDCGLTSHGFARRSSLWTTSAAASCARSRTRKGDYRECEAEFVKQLRVRLGALRAAAQPRPPPRNITLYMQLAATPYCQVRPIVN